MKTRAAPQRTEGHCDLSPPAGSRRPALEGVGPEHRDVTAVFQLGNRPYMLEQSRDPPTAVWVRSVCWLSCPCSSVLTTAVMSDDLRNGTQGRIRGEHGRLRICKRWECWSKVAAAPRTAVAGSGGHPPPPSDRRRELVVPDPPLQPHQPGATGGGPENRSPVSATLLIIALLHSARGYHHHRDDHLCLICIISLVKNPRVHTRPATA